jgi:hypothetical protein
VTESPCGLRLDKEIGYNIVKCMKEAYDSIKFCVKCGEVKDTRFVKERRGVRQGYSLSPYLFSTFTGNTTDYISRDNLHTSTTGAQIISGLLFADDFPTSSSAING